MAKSTHASTQDDKVLINNKIIVGGKNILKFKGASVSNGQQYDALRMGIKKNNVYLDLKIDEDPFR